MAGKHAGRGTYVPFGTIADAVLHDLGLGYGTNLLEKLLEFLGAKPGSQLLNKDCSAVTLILGQRGRSGVARSRCLAILAAICIGPASVGAVVVAISARIVRTMAAGRVGARAGTAIPVVVVVPVTSSMTT